MFLLFAKEPVPEEATFCARTYCRLIFLIFLELYAMEFVFKQILSSISLILNVRVSG